MATAFGGRLALFVQRRDPSRFFVSVATRSLTAQRLKSVLFLLGWSVSWLSLSMGALAAEASLERTTQPAADGSPVMTPDVYLLGPGDGLSLRFPAATELSGQIDVLNDGTATLPLIGSVVLGGLTIPQAILWLEKLYSKELLRPEVQLSVVRPRPIRVAVVGEVERPGLYTLTTTETSQTEARVQISGLPTVVDVIQKAGGVTDLADLGRVEIQRRLPGALPRFKKASLNLLALVRDGDQLQNPLLFDGDTIRIERADESVAEAIELSSTTLAPQEIKVFVVGEVERPGPLSLTANTPLIQAVLAAGGPRSWRANKGNVQLVRINRNGTATRRSFMLNLNQGASNSSNPPLRSGDTVVVTRSGMAMASDAINAVSQPLTGLANILALVQLLKNTGN